MSTRPKPDHDFDSGEVAVEPGHDAFVRAKVERGLVQSRDRASMISVNADARAEADVLNGRLITHDAVRRWVQSIGTDKPLPRPRVG